jgi:hypothetical protein
VGAVVWCRAVSRSRRLHIRSRERAPRQHSEKLSEAGFSSTPHLFAPKLAEAPNVSGNRRSRTLAASPADRSGGVKTELLQRSEEERS